MSSAPRHRKRHEEKNHGPYSLRYALCTLLFCPGTGTGPFSLDHSTFHIETGNWLRERQVFLDRKLFPAVNCAEHQRSGYPKHRAVRQRPPLVVLIRGLKAGLLEQFQVTSGVPCASRLPYGYVCDPSRVCPVS